MTNDEIDALIIAAHPTDPAKFVESGTFEYDRLIFRAGMEQAAKICEGLTKRNPNGRGYITLDAIDYADAIRAAANDQ